MPMNTPTILLYNLDNPRGAKIRRMCLSLRLRTALVPRESYGLPLGALAEGAVPETPYSGDGFDDEMLLIVNCPGPLLDLFLQAFRRQKLAPVRLKAVLTPTNREWDSVALHAELCRERQAIAEGQAAHRKGPRQENAGGRGLSRPPAGPRPAGAGGGAGGVAAGAGLHSPEKAARL